MMAGIQIFGIIFALAMCYFTFLYYKRKDYPKTDYMIWMGIWLGFLLLVTFPDIPGGILHPLGIASAMQLFTIIGFLIAYAIIAYQHAVIRKTEQKMSKLTREMSIGNAKRK